MAKANSAVSLTECNKQTVAPVVDIKSPPIEEGASLNEVLHLAHSTVETLKTFLGHLDKTIGDDFHQIMEKIDQTREDMSQLNIKSSENCPIASAENELQMVVKATEEATNRIMESAETIMTADPSEPGSYHLVVEQNILEIFEACTFQDITGQRINRVVDTLEFVDYRIHKIASLLGLENEFGKRDFDEKTLEDKHKRKEDLMLHGPQDQQEAISQNAIDDLF